MVKSCIRPGPIQPCGCARPCECSYDASRCDLSDAVIYVFGHVHGARRVRAYTPGVVEARVRPDAVPVRCRPRSGQRRHADARGLDAADAAVAGNIHIAKRIYRHPPRTAEASVGAGGIQPCGCARSSQCCYDACRRDHADAIVVRVGHVYNTRRAHHHGTWVVKLCIGPSAIQI